MNKKKNNFVKFAKTSEKKLPLTYVGTSFPNGDLPRFTTFSDGTIPQHLLNKVKNVASFKSLFVKSDELGAAMVNVKIKGNPLYLNNKIIENELYK